MGRDLSPGCPAAQGGVAIACGEGIAARMASASPPSTARRRAQFGLVDLFSGAGGMSCGFVRHPAFRVLAAADAELAKPSMKAGSLQCNATYAANIGISPVRLDLSAVNPEELRARLGLGDQKIHVLSACPPCTGFSRTNPQNHLRDDRRNSLVQRAAEFATALEADIVVMENARELLRGNFAGHFAAFRAHLEAHGFQVWARNCMLSKFGLPQVRERALVIAARRDLPLHTLDELWHGWKVAPSAVSVRAAWRHIADADDHECPAFASAAVAARLAAIPADGGSWADLVHRRDSAQLLTAGMKRILSEGKIGSHPDVYGRMWWDRPAPTIKRECSHTGNGRYAHPCEPRLCTLREMASLQGFPADYQFAGSSLSNNYRHLGDAVPPLISHQLAYVCHWMLTGRRPRLREAILSGTHLRAEDFVHW
jgi:DNA (cytosine-5)-methyltransferase 1